MVDEVMLRAQKILPGATTRLAARVANPADVAAALLPLLDSTPAAEVWAALHSEGGKPGAKGARPATAKPAAGDEPAEEHVEVPAGAGLGWQADAMPVQCAQSVLQEGGSAVSSRSKPCLTNNKLVVGAAKPAAKGSAVPEAPASFKQHVRYVEMAALIMEAAVRQGQSTLVLQWAEGVQRMIREGSSVPRPGFDRWELQGVPSRQHSQPFCWHSGCLALT